MEIEAEPIRILVVDDHPAVRQGLGLLLEPEGIMVCAEADSCAKALEQLEAHRPGVVLVDISLSDEDGFGLIENLHRRSFPCLVYSMHEDGWHVERAFASGALGYVTKREVHKVLVEAIRKVAAGQRFVSPNAAVALAEQAASSKVNAYFEELSGQEQQVYRLLGMGLPTRDIAAGMNISPRTVESYYARMVVKLELGGVPDLRRHAIRHFHNLPL